MMLIKRIFDIIFSLLGIIILLPIFITIAISIKLDSPGSIFFRQIRVGRFGKSFYIYKFRTMIANAEQVGKLLTINNDWRITKSGQFLRKHKLDELPQLFNILKGEMSFVGPRPEVPGYVAFYTPQQREILQIRPGITDLASLTFHTESELLTNSSNIETVYLQEIMPQKLAINKQYLEQANLVSDILIILKTIRLIVNC